jgi:hypothetical protein
VFQPPTSAAASSVSNPEPSLARAAGSGPPSVLSDPRTQNLIALSEMGFLNDRLNDELLDRYNENMENVVADLLLRERRR